MMLVMILALFIVSLMFLIGITIWAAVEGADLNADPAFAEAAVKVYTDVLEGYERFRL